MSPWRDAWWVTVERIAVSLACRLLAVCRLEVVSLHIRSKRSGCAPLRLEYEGVSLRRIVVEHAEPPLSEGRRPC